MGTVEVIARIVLAAVFVTAGVGKLLDLEGSRRAIRDFGVPPQLAKPAGLLLPLAELAAAVALVFRPTAQSGAVAALLLLLAFVGGIANALRHGVAPDCHCFGQIHSEPAGKSTLIRNGILGGIAVVVVFAGSGPAIDTWVRTHSAAELIAVVLGFGLIVLTAFYVQLLTEVRELRAEIGTARRVASSAPPGLPVGTPAPAFQLETIEGGKVTLDELRKRTPVLLVFTSPWCSGCGELYPSIRRWQQTLQERLKVVVLAAGAASDNEPLRSEYGLTDVLLQDGRETIESFRVRATPTAMLVSRDGRIAAAPAETMFGIEPLVRLVLRDGEHAAAPPALEISPGLA